MTFSFSMPSTSSSPSFLLIYSHDVLFAEKVFNWIWIKLNVLFLCSRVLYVNRVVCMCGCNLKDSVSLLWMKIFKGIIIIDVYKCVIGFEVLKEIDCMTNNILVVNNFKFLNNKSSNKSINYLIISWTKHHTVFDKLLKKTWMIIKKSIVIN